MTERKTGRKKEQKKDIIIERQKNGITNSRQKNNHRKNDISN